jgi:hypothetical protein
MSLPAHLGQAEFSGRPGGSGSSVDLIARKFKAP